MKKVIYFAALLLTTVFASCEKEEIGGTATESMAGQWYCIVDAVDDNGNPIIAGEDYFGEGKTIWITYNTSGNASSEMWVDNLGIGNFSAAYSSYFPQYIAILDGDTAAAKNEYHNSFPSYTIKTKVSIDQVSIDQDTLKFRSIESENFGEGYQWWIKKVKLDAKGDTVWTDEKKKEPVMTDVMINEEKSLPVTIEGKILKGAGRQNNGSPADSIILFVTYKDDPWYPGDGYTRYKVSGIRYSGLEEND